MTGYVHSIYSGGMVDGPGIRCVVFLSGCALRCKYCHNPDTWSRRSGNVMTVDEVLAEVLSYKSYYKFSGGGVTISGGEPLGQAEFMTELLKACKANDIHTVIDTSGFAKPEDVADVLEYTDLMLLDIKSINPITYKMVTGVEIERSFETLRLSRRMKVATWIRFVLVPGLTDDMDDIRQMAEFLRGFDNIEKIDVLPFHKSGEHKWDENKTPYELADTEPPSPEFVQEVQEILSGSL